MEIEVCVTIPLQASLHEVFQRDLNSFNWEKSAFQDVKAENEQEENWR